MPGFRRPSHIYTYQRSSQCLSFSTHMEFLSISYNNGYINSSIATLYSEILPVHYASHEHHISRLQQLATHNIMLCPDKHESAKPSRVYI